MTKVVDSVFKTLLPFLARAVLVQKLGCEVVDVVFKTFVSNSTSLRYVGGLVDNPLSIKLCPLIVTPLTRFPKGILPTGLSGS